MLVTRLGNIVAMGVLVLFLCSGSSSGLKQRASVGDACTANGDCNVKECEACFCQKPVSAPNVCKCGQGYSGTTCDKFCDKGCFPYWQMENPEWQKWFKPREMKKSGILAQPATAEHFNAWPTTAWGTGGP